MSKHTYIYILLSFVIVALVLVLALVMTKIIPVPESGINQPVGAQRSRALRRRRLAGELVTSEQDVQAALQDSAPVLVFVQAEWCGYCKKQLPIWEEVAPTAGINMMRIDAKDAPNIMKDFGITGFPTFVSNRGEKKYVGFRDSQKLVSLVTSLKQ
jgi:thiol-disulfide isomerase/thioredoxin